MTDQEAMESKLRSRGSSVLQMPFATSELPSWRFMRGYLNYLLSVNSFAEFLIAYWQENCVVSQQVLALHPQESHRLYTCLETTLHSSALFYRYQFFADNCTTRLWRAIHASVETPLQVDST
jgi:hypothetical protein